jgi:GT2 family glycosyltransferase
MTAPSIDIAVVNYRGAADTLQALARLAQWPYGTVWLVDNSAHEADVAADTAALREACAEMPWVTLLTPGVNLGFGRACNLAFAESQAEFFLLLNPDARITTVDVLLLARTLAEQPRLGAVSPKIYWNDQRSFVLPAAFPQTPWFSVALALATRSRRVAQWAAQLGLKKAMRQMASKNVVEVSFLAGAVMMLRREAVLSAGALFDPDYFMFFEDSDLSLRLRRAGYALALAPAACAVHEYRHKAFKAGLMAQSQQQYFSKQYPAFYRWSDGLARVAALARPMNPAAWFKVLAQPVKSAQEFAELTGAGRVLAFSPSMLMMPALFRPSVAEASCFDEQEWALLEPAAYTALVAGADPAAAPMWVYFERADEARASSALSG